MLSVLPWYFGTPQIPPVMQTHNPTAVTWGWAMPSLAQAAVAVPRCQDEAGHVCLAGISLPCTFSSKTQGKRMKN